MVKPAPTFTIDDLLAELKPEDSEEGISYREICIKWGWPPTGANLDKVRFIMQDLLVKGEWERVGKKQIYNEVAEQMVWVKAYRPKGEDE